MKECAALGHAVAQWSFLEEKILQATLGIAAEFRPTDPPDARQHAFRTYSVVVEQIPSGAAQTYYMAIRDRIAAENSFPPETCARHPVLRRGRSGLSHRQKAQRWGALLSDCSMAIASSSLLTASINFP